MCAIRTIVPKDVDDTLLRMSMHTKGFQAPDRTSRSRSRTSAPTVLRPWTSTWRTPWTPAGTIRRSTRMILPSRRAKTPPRLLLQGK
eukprot:604385-Heterocapsa_arctica.AAC.1